MMAIQHHQASLQMSVEPVRRISITYQQPSRQESQVVITEAPITPPLSPKSTANKSEGMVIEEIPVYSTTKESVQLQAEGEAMDITPMESVEVTTLPPREKSIVEPHKRPQRLLEDEKVRLQGSGLNLSDFEVRGTLGRQIQTNQPCNISHPIE